MLIEDEVGRAMLALTSGTTDVHVAHPLEQASHRLDDNVMSSSSGHLGVVGGFEDITLWLELHQREEAPLTIREVLLEQVDPTLLISGGDEVDDASTHPFDRWGFEAGLELDGSREWTPKDTLEYATVVCVRD